MRQYVLLLICFVKSVTKVFLTFHPASGRHHHGADRQTTSPTRDGEGGDAPLTHDGEDSPRSHRLQRQDAKSRKTFKIKRHRSTIKANILRSATMKENLRCKGGGEPNPRGWDGRAGNSSRGGGLERPFSPPPTSQGPPPPHPHPSLGGMLERMETESEEPPEVDTTAAGDKLSDQAHLAEGNLSPQNSLKASSGESQGEPGASGAVPTIPAAGAEGRARTEDRVCCYIIKSKI